MTDYEKEKELYDEKRSFEENAELTGLARTLLSTRAWVYDLKHSESRREHKQKRIRHQTEQQAFEQYCREQDENGLPERIGDKYQSINGDWLVTLYEYRKEQWDYQRWHYAGSGMEKLYLLKEGEYDFFPEEGYWEKNHGDQIYVSRYEKVRAYGGPEEGGWYRSIVSHDAFLGPLNTFREAYAVLRELKRIQWLQEIKDRRANGAQWEPDWESLGGDETVSSTYPEGYTPTGWVCAKEHFYKVEPITGLYEYADSPHYE